MSSDRAVTLERLYARWQRQRRAVDAVTGLAIGAVSYAAAHWLLGLPSLPAAAGAATAAAAAWWAQAPWRRDDPALLARHLDRVLPELEESAELLLAGRGDRSSLAQLQRRRATKALGAASARAVMPRREGRRAARNLAFAGLACLACWLAGWALGATTGAAGREQVTPEAAPVAVVGAALEEAILVIRPPAYTGLDERRVSGLTASVEEGAEISWQLRASGPVERAELVFDERRSLALAPEGGGWFSGSGEVVGSHLYRVVLADADRDLYRGEYARLTVIPDRAPVVEIVRPGPLTIVAAGNLKRVEVAVRAADDYGLGETGLIATLASGSGEQVRFRERRLPLRRGDGEQGSRDLQAMLDLRQLGLEAGSELYLFAEAWDRRRPEAQRSRSATHILRVPGERRRSLDLGAGLPVLFLPEFFRSQRQIILDTERLLEEEPRLARTELARRSQELGFDQRALRTRYGGLLGEEFESGRPVGDAEADEEPEEYHLAEEPASGTGLAALLEQLPDGFSHSHDAAEINTFFDQEVKAKLKAALREMWSAEGRLRSIEPREALPYEVRALHHLKSAQEAQRAFVGKVGFESPPLEPERRLTGELDEIRRPRRSFPREPSLVAPEIERAWAVAARLRLDGGDLPEGFDRLAEELLRHLLGSAPAPEALDLEVLGLLRRWSREVPAAVPGRELDLLESLLWSRLPVAEPAPAPRLESDAPLWRRYRERLGESE